MSDFNCSRLPKVAREFSKQLKVTAELTRENFTPYFPVYAATFRHECTNYDKLLCALPGIFPKELDDEPSENWLLCVCPQNDYDYQGHECINEGIAHDILQSAANDLAMLRLEGYKREYSKPEVPIERRGGEQDDRD